MRYTDWNQWLEQLGTEMYNSPDAYQRALPELQDLQQCGNLYKSSYKLNGEHRPKAKDKTIILAAAPMVVIEHGERPQNLIKYIMQRDGTDFIHTAEMLAGYVCMELPKGDYNQEQQQKWAERATKQELLTTAQEYYKWCLHNADGAEPQREYLQHRFTAEEVDKMGLGYIPSQAQLTDYLLGKGYDKAEIQAALTSKQNAAVGTTHKITIPIYRAGNLWGWIYRHHNQPEAAELKKYQYPIRLDGEPQQNLQFDFIPASLRNDSEIVVVEGQLDAAHLLAAGVRNVVATGTNAVNAEQVKDAVKRGCKGITLMYDADPLFDKQGNSTPDVNYNHRCRAISTILDTLKEMGKEEDVRLYVADLPQQDPAVKVDPDSYLNNAGADAIQTLLENSSKYWQYQILHLSKPYDGQIMTPKQLEEYEDKMLSIYGTIAKPLDKQLCRDMLAEILEGVDGGTIDELLSTYQTKQAELKAQHEAADLLRQSATLMQQGETARALELQNKATLIATAAANNTAYEEMRKPLERGSIAEELQGMPEALHTGLYFGKQTEDNEIILPAGALSILAAPTSHGKTTMLVSLATNAAKANPDKKQYILSYEEARAAVVVKALSCYAGLEVSASNRKTIEHYLKTGSTEYFYQDEEVVENFKKQERLFWDMTGKGRLHISYTNMYCEVLCSTIRRLAEAGDLGAVFVDYVQEIDLANAAGTYSKAERISRICRQLLDVAVDTGTPIVLGAQFNREVSDPTALAATNIADGSEIEHKAAYIIGFWNNDMPYQSSKKYKPNLGEIAELTKNHLFDAGKKNKNKSVYAMVLKNRSGLGAKAGTSGLLGFNGNIGCVDTYEEREQEQTKSNIPDYTQFDSEI